LEHSRIGGSKAIEGQEIKGKKNIKQGRARSSNYNGIACWCQLECVISLLALACRVHACLYWVLLLSLEWVSQGVIVVFILSFPFMNSHGVMGFLLFGLDGLSNGLKAKLGGI